MSKKTNYSYISIAFILLVFGIIFIPRIVDRITNKDVKRSDESRSKLASTEVNNNKPLMFITQNGVNRKVPEFSFTNQDGKTINNKDFDGKVYLVEFFFTSCPTICPKMTKNLVNIQNNFQSASNDFGIASFSIAGSFDTPEVLKGYAEHYGVTNPNWHFLTGDQGVIFKLANEGFYLHAAEDPLEDGGFSHSGNFALIDKNGFIRSRGDEYGNPKIYYRGVVSEEEKFDDDGEEEEVSILKEDIAKLLKE